MKFLKLLIIPLFAIALVACGNEVVKSQSKGLYENLNSTSPTNELKAPKDLDDAILSPLSWTCTKGSPASGGCSMTCTQGFIINQCTNSNCSDCCVGNESTGKPTCFPPA